MKKDEVILDWVNCATSKMHKGGGFKIRHTRGPPGGSAG